MARITEEDESNDDNDDDDEDDDDDDDDDDYDDDDYKAGDCRRRKLLGNQSLEFVTEMRILAEMKIENRPKKIFSLGKIRKHTFFL